MKPYPFQLCLILTTILCMGFAVEKCGINEDTISISVKAEFFEQAIQSAFRKTTTVKSSSSFKKTLNQLKTSASFSGSYGAFSASAAASYESLSDSVLSTTKYDETSHEEKTEFHPGFLQIIREIVTRVSINDIGASVSEREFVDSVPTGKSLSSSQLQKMGEDHMTFSFGSAKTVKNTLSETICKPKKGCGPENVTLVSGDFYDNYKPFRVLNIFTQNLYEAHGNYWLGPDKSPATFILDLGCKLSFGGIRLVNIHNIQHRDRATKTFRVSVSNRPSGPWTKVLETTLRDSRQQQDPLPLQMMPLKGAASAQFVRFNLLSWYGLGGGLQYFDIQRDVESYVDLPDGVTCAMRGLKKVTGTKCQEAARSLGYKGSVVMGNGCSVQVTRECIRPGTEKRLINICNLFMFD